MEGTFNKNRIYLNFGFSHTTCFATKNVYNEVGNFDLGYKFNIIKQINIGLYLRGQSMILGSLDPPIDGGGTLETLSIGLIFEGPVYLVY